jgi:hypothetical protein
VHDVEIKYMIDRGTRAVEVQERGRIRGVGPSRGDMEPSYISTTMLKSINAVGWIVRAWWYQRLPVRHQIIVCKRLGSVVGRGGLEGRYRNEAVVGERNANVLGCNQCKCTIARRGGGWKFVMTAPRDGMLDNAAAKPAGADIPFSVHPTLADTRCRIRPVLPMSKP